MEGELGQKCHRIGFHAIGSCAIVSGNILQAIASDLASLDHTLFYRTIYFMQLDRTSYHWNIPSINCSSQVIASGIILSDYVLISLYRTHFIASGIILSDYEQISLYRTHYTGSGIILS